MSEAEEEYEDDEQLSAEDITKVVKHFIKNANEGEQYIVAAKLKALYPDFSDDDLQQALIDRAIRNCAVVGAPDHPTIMSEMTKVENETTFFNPTENKAYTVAFPLDGKGGAKPAQLTEVDVGGDCYELVTGGAKSDFTDAVQKELDGYIQSNYTSESSAAGVALGDEDELRILISADSQNIDSYWDGTWVNSYTLSDSTLKGTIKLSLHYFENGNVMLTSEKEVEFPEVKKGDPADVITAVREVETKFQLGLTEYLGKHSHSIKDVRRGLTVQGTKFDWRPGVHKVADTLA